jgi:L-rhamnose mutarotase
VSLDGSGCRPAQVHHLVWTQQITGTRGRRTEKVKGAAMPRVCFTLQVDPNRLEEYKVRHTAVWPDMLTALRHTGWSNYSLFLREDGLLVGYLETDDFAAAQAAMDRTEVNRRWQAEMASFFTDLPGGRADLGMRLLDEVFNLDQQIAARDVASPRSDATERSPISADANEPPGEQR